MFLRFKLYSKPKMRLYFHSINNLTEARFAAACLPDYIGFNFSPKAPNYISPVEFSKIQSWLSGSEIVGQFTLEPLEDIEPLLASFNIYTVEVLPEHPQIQDFLDLGLKVILKNPSQHFKHLPYRCAKIEDYLIHTEQGFLEIEPSDSSLEFIQSNNIENIALAGKSENEAGLADLADWSNLMEALEIF
jgi:hypothetical protein